MHRKDVAAANTAGQGLDRVDPRGIDERDGAFDDPGVAGVGGVAVGVAVGVTDTLVDTATGLKGDFDEEWQFEKWSVQRRETVNKVIFLNFDVMLKKKIYVMLCYVYVVLWVLG